MVGTKAVIKKLMYIFNKRQKTEMIILLIGIGISAFLELVGVSVIYPFLEVILNPEAITTKSYLAWLNQTFQIETVNGFLLLLAIILILVYMLKNVFQFAVICYRNKVINDNQTKSSVLLLRRYMKREYLYFANKNSSELIRNIQDDVYRFYTLMFMALNLFSNGLVTVTMFLYLIITDPVMTIASFGVMGIFSLILYQFYKPVAQKYGIEAHNALDERYKWIHQCLGGVKEIKLLQREKFFVDKYEKSTTIYYKDTKINSIYNELPKYLIESMSVATILLVVTFKLQNYAQLSEFIPTLAVFAAALFRIFPRVSEMNSCLNTIIYNMPSLDLIYDSLKETAEFHTTDEEVRQPQEMIFKKAIELRHVTFRYPNTDKDVLRDISLEIKKGDSVALIGGSGAGKSTLSDIILGLVYPTEGEILADGQNIRENPEGWMKKIGYVPQSIYLLDDTIRNNVVFGQENVDEHRLRSTLKQAQLEEYLEELPKGLDTVIGERGTRISGGQRQRIGIARALYNNPDILVLDEATSALDNETEAAVMSAIDNLQGVKTMIIIAHRLTTVKNCNLIYKIQDGKAIQVKSAQ